VKGSILVKLSIALALLGAAAIAGVIAFRTGPMPTIEISAELPAIGRRTPVKIVAREPVRGLSRIRTEFVQGDRVEILDERVFTPRAAWNLWSFAEEASELRIEVGTETIAGLKDGPASIRVTADAAPAWLRTAPPALETLKLDVKLRPPTLEVLSKQTYVSQGGAEAVVYRVGADAVRHGVRAGDWFFPGSPLPGSARGERFALFGVPYDLEDVERIRLFAIDAVGNSVEVAFVDRFTPRPFKTETIELSDAFMARVVPPILASAPELGDRGGLLENYLAINGELRRKNAATLVEYAKASRPAFLWREVFLQFPNAKVMSGFADRRSYVLDGKEVDRQDHLGFDLASTQQAELIAVNDGIVQMARYFGIYGNAVLIDHGFGLASLYGHLSEISVTEGAEVKRGQIIGRSGKTGLAGGDHLHFTMLLQGLAVDPREWWDANWIEDRLDLKLGAGLPFEPAR
jgi:murein DD-endopeptidase MepM/ murein hydrolase activator NlpD